jgi:hypothetical protein
MISYLNEIGKSDLGLLNVSGRIRFEGLQVNPEGSAFGPRARKTINDPGVVFKAEPDSLS